jgi:signal transduction histidine kinase
MTGHAPNAAAEAADAKSPTTSLWDRLFDERLDAVATQARYTFWPRVAIVAAASTLFGLNLGLAAALAWVVGWVIAEAWSWQAAMLMQPPKGPTFRRRLNYIAATFFSSLTWSAMAFAYWRTGVPALQLVAATCLAGLLLHTASFCYRSPAALAALGAAPSVLWLILPIFFGGFTGLPALTLTAYAVLMLLYVYAAVDSNSRKAAALDHAIRSTQAANEAKSAFLAMMSHELRTPMNGVLGMARALQSAKLDPQHAASIDIIMRSGEHMMSVLNDVLDMSKIEAGRLDLEVTAFDLVDAGDRVVMLWSGAAADKGLDLNYDADPGMHPWVLGDVNRVRQIMLNLVSNAIKFTDKGEVRLAIRAQASPEGAPGVEIIVSDTGIGLSPEQQAKLFSPFVQADASTARRFGGTGLGLSICRRLTDLMGGTIRVESRLGEGATFVVWLPLTRAEAPAALAEEHAAHALPSLRVLVVEDNPINQAVARAILDATGAITETAGDGVEALARLRDEPFDVVLMDVHMPNMDGIEALRRIRAGEAGPADIPVIALTGDVTPGEDARLHGLGFDALQPKPIQPAGLIGSIFQVLTRGPGAAAA